MCGIVGYIGEENAKEIVLNGLEKLEYRGYDSAGIALVCGEKIEVFKDKGRISHLRKLCSYGGLSKMAIGHTRWATHGVPNKVNSHPHLSNSNRFCIVHNGVIENYRKLKIEYLSDYKFYSDTDTEVIVNLIEFFSKGLSVNDAIIKTISLLEGSYALLIIDNLELNKIYFAKKKIELIFYQYIQLVYKFDFNIEQLEQAYYKKLEKNYKRFDK